MSTEQRLENLMVDIARTAKMSDPSALAGLPFMLLNLAEIVSAQQLEIELLNIRLRGVKEAFELRPVCGYNSTAKSDGWVR